MTLQQMLTALSTEQLKKIHEALINSGIASQLSLKKGRHKVIFSMLRDMSHGKQRKIYAALAKASRDDMNRIVDVMIGLKK